MKMEKVVRTVILIVFAVLGGRFLWVLFLSANYDPIGVLQLAGKPAPSISVALLDNPYHVSELPSYLGKKVVVVTFWASWCQNCEEYNRRLRLIQQKYDFKSIGVAYKDKIADARKWIQESPDPFEINLIDPGGRLARMFDSLGIPGSVIVDENKVVVKRVNMAEEIETYLSEHYYGRTNKKQARPNK